MKKNVTVVTGLLLLFCISASDLFAQSKTYKEINGFEFGERISENYHSIRYLEHLEQTSDRVKLIDLGFSWDKRPMKMAIVTSPENHQRLDEIRENAQALNDPRATSDAAASRIMENQPTVVYLGGSIHGFELSGSDAMLKLLEKLVTQDTPEIREMLSNTVVLIDPMINPDGRDAFAQFNHQRTGRQVNPSRDDWNNDFTRWQALQFRTSHYYFDMNRDWFAQTHPEIRSRAAVIQDWRPQVGVDAHEMGSDMEFYFDPPTDPYAPFFPEHAKNWFPEFGMAYADAFNEAGFEYTSHEMFNYFYPGYTTSFLTYQGAVGLLFEQGSTRGLAITRADGSVRTYADAVEQQYVASLATVRLSSDRRKELLQSYFDDHKKAIADGRNGYQRYFITPDGDPGLVKEAANLLMRVGVEVGILQENTSVRNARDRYGKNAGNVTLPAGTLVIEASQPRNRYIRTLLEPRTDVPEAFLETARERIDRGENPRFYDMTSWSLPLMFNLTAYSAGGARINAPLIEGEFTPDLRFPAQQPTYAYILDGKQTAALSVLYRMKTMGYRAGVLSKATQIEGKPFASGSVFFRTGINDESLHADLREWAEYFGVHVHGLNTGMGDNGNLSLGSTAVMHVNEPKVAIIAEEPISGLSFGFAWHKLDRQYEIDHTILRGSSIAGTDLSAFNVIILPEIFGAGAMNQVLGEAGQNRLRQWVRDGGTLVSLGSATEYVRKDLELSGLVSFYDHEDHAKLPQISVPGAFVKGVPDGENWLTSGYEGEIPFLVFSSRLYRFPKTAPSQMQREPLRASETEPIIAGHAWSESVERLPNSTLVYEERVGRGRVIMFSEDTNFRGYWRGLDRMFLNAVILGPSGQ
jgi:hypothetical protein